MRILVTNDDGIHSPGLEALADLAARVGEVRVVAPDTEQSSVAHAITASRPLHHRHARVGRHEAYRVDGTPADCVALGTNLWGEVDVVVSGINLGLNVGHAMWHSGTLAAAKQAALLGIRGVAFSAPVSDEDRYGPELLAWAEDVLRLVIAEPDLALVNVNLPTRPRGLRWTKQSVRRYLGKVFRDEDPFGRRHYWFGALAVEPPEPDTDRAAIEAGCVSITPLRLDLTDHEALGRARADLAAIRAPSAEATTRRGA